MSIKNNYSVNGQGTVEYILLLAVVSSIVVSILGSNRFQNFMGPDSSFFSGLRSYQEYTYRHGSPGWEDTSTTESGGVHALYINVASPKGRATRFFIPLEKYPQ